MVISGLLVIFGDSTNSLVRVVGFRFLTKQDSLTVLLLHWQKIVVRLLPLVLVIQLVVSSRISFVAWKGKVGSSSTRMAHLELKATYSCTSTNPVGTFRKSLIKG